MYTICFSATAQDKKRFGVHLFAFRSLRLHVLASPRRAFGPGLSYLGLSGRWILHFLSVRTRGPARSWAASGTSFVRVVALSISGVPAPPFGTLPYIARHMHAGNGE